MDLTSQHITMPTKYSGLSKKSMGYLPGGIPAAAAIRMKPQGLKMEFCKVSIIFHVDIGLGNAGHISLVVQYNISCPVYSNVV